MHIVAAAAALLLLLIVLSPIVFQRVRVARRARAVHLHGSCHWYANYDEDLRYEPSSGLDIVMLPREEVLRRGYQPTSDVHVVPRTFRNRVPGDVKIRLWRSDGSGAPPLWLCEWAINPVRVAIGVGDRARVPGVESGSVPTEAAVTLEAPRVIGESDWSEGPATPMPVALEPILEALATELPGKPPTDEAAVEASNSEDASTDEAAVAASNSPEMNPTDSGKRGRSRRRRRRPR